MQVRHVEGSRQSVQQSDAAEQQRGRDQAQGGVAHGAVQLRRRSSQYQQGQRGDEHDLEPDVQIEDVSRQERTAHARQQRVQQGMQSTGERAGPRVPECVDHGRQPDQGGDRDHRRAQVIRHQRVFRREPATGRSARTRYRPARRIDSRPAAAPDRPMAPARLTTLCVLSLARAPRSRSRPRPAGTTIGQTSSQFNRPPPVAHRRPPARVPAARMRSVSTVSSSW